MKTTCEIERWLNRTAAKYGWSVGLQSVASTGSHYYELCRALPADGESDDPRDWTELDTFTVRIADHGSCYCSEDYSLVAGQESGDDATTEAVEARLARHGRLSRLQRAILKYDCRECAEHAIAKTRDRYAGRGEPTGRCSECNLLVQ